MHVALVHLRHARSGGTEGYLNQLAAYLLDHGHEVTVVCRSHAPDPATGLRFVVLRAPVPGKLARVWGFARDVERHLASASYDVVLGLGWTWSQHVIRLGGGCLGTHRLLALDNGLPPSSGLPRLHLKIRLAEAIERRALAPGRYEHVIVNSEMVRRDAMRRYAIEPERISVVYNGVDLERFDRGRHAEAAATLRRDLGVAPAAPLIAFVASSYDRKGLDTLLAALPDVLAAQSETTLLVVGNDSRQHTYERLAHRLGIADACRFAGGRSDVATCLAAADLFALPTRYDPFANVTLEALASGVPVLTTPTNGASEIVDDGTHGAIVADRNPGSWTRALVAWVRRCRDDATRAACRARAERHPAARAAYESIAILEAVAARRGSSRPDRMLASSG